MEEIRSLALFYKVERGGGSSWGVAAASRRPLAKSDFAKRQRSLTFLLWLPFPPSCPAALEPAARPESQSLRAAAGVAGKFSAAHFAPPLA